MATDCWSQAFPPKCPAHCVRPCRAVPGLILPPALVEWATRLTHAPLLSISQPFFNTDLPWRLPKTHQETKTLLPPAILPHPQICPKLDLPSFSKLVLPYSFPGSKDGPVILPSYIPPVLLSPSNLIHTKHRIVHHCRWKGLWILSNLPGLSDYFPAFSTCSEILLYID